MRHPAIGSKRRWTPTRFLILFIGTTGGALLDLGSATFELSTLRAALDRAFELPGMTGTA